MRPRSDERQRFLVKVRESATGCHEWQAGLDRGGYGKFSGYSTSDKAHRRAYELFVGAIPTGLHVLHRCDNRKCVNPEHLFVGTAADNVTDMDSKGRRGSRSRLTHKDAEKIKNLLASRYSQTKVAAMFGVDQTTISRVKTGVTALFQEGF